MLSPSVVAAAEAAVAAMALGGCGGGVRPANPTMAQLNAERLARARATEDTRPTPNPNPNP